MPGNASEFMQMLLKAEGIHVNDGRGLGPETALGANTRSTGR